MINLGSNIIVVIYGLTVLLILFYTTTQLFLFLNYIFIKKTETKFEFPEENLPYVTIQLPIYNEKYVVERLLSNIVKIDYPKDKIEIQVLDDSTDESLEQNIILVDKLKNEGHNIVHLHRINRENFKAGALKAGLITAKGEFIAIFDADFLPQSNWLRSCISNFSDPKIGVVQTRWHHINRDYSVLTMVQGMALDHHFTVEQTGRNQANHFINFNGTAGVWRKTCIIDAGNWEGDTLTEDLDLSYRAQLKNWKFVYLENLGTPSELPVAISAIRTQQFRWNKGGAENFRKNINKIIKSDILSFNTKIQAFAHLLNSSVFLWAFLLSILSVPMVLIKTNSGFLNAVLGLGTFVKYNYALLIIVFYVSYRKTQSKSIAQIPKFIFQYLVFFPVILGLTFHNSLAVLEGYFGIKSAFVRTPKFNIQSNSDTWKTNQYLSKKLTFAMFAELLLVFYFAFGIYLGVVNQVFGYVAFHSILVLGYSFVFFSSINE
jgi:cellulose synthase/poly-beta-1,6-N-acetylglucosamine synthase-like glycosyltransferase